MARMVVGMALDVEGRPICCEMWPGNTADVKTLLPIVKRMRERFSLPLALRGGVLVPAQPEDIDMFQHQFPLSPEAAGQAGDSPAFAARPSLTAHTAHGGEAVPTGQPLPRQWKRHRACSPQRPCSREAAASFTLILTVLAGAMQWIYCPAPRSDF